MLLIRPGCDRSPAMRDGITRPAVLSHENSSELEQCEQHCNSEE
jgi:hypothetical protein